MANFWMVRAGSGGSLISDFERLKCVAIGFDQDAPFDLSHLGKEELAARVREKRPGLPAAQAGNIVGMLHKFASQMRSGDRIITYDPQQREYLVGTVSGDYRFEPNLIPRMDHIRPVEWDRRVSRDALSARARAVLSGWLTLFEPAEEVRDEIEQIMRNGSLPLPETQEEEREPLETIREDLVSRAHELIKDRITSLQWDEMQELVAAILRAMNYRTRVSPQGSDRGKDIVASPDGLGLAPPRIKVEVKHRQKTQIGAPELRSFIGGLRGDDRGLYVSTGGFTTEAMYEAERASVPVTLLNLDDVASLLVQHYDSLDSDGRALVPLIRIFWPAS